MSQTDSFIEEVTEEVRRDQLYRTFRRYGWIAALVVVLIVGGAAWREYTRARDAAAAQALGDSLLAALETPDAAERVAALAAVETTGDAGAVAALLTAAAAQEAGDTAAAVAALDKLAADMDVAAYYRDLATLKSVLLQASDTAPEDRITRLDPLTPAGAPFRLLAEEQIALAEIEMGDTASAIDRLQRLSEDTDASATLRRRAQELIVALGGTPSPA
ncbi:MAG: tetratricopeptide repeat protein [Paracoccaceae bacterium]